MRALATLVRLLPLQEGRESEMGLRETAHAGRRYGYAHDQDFAIDYKPATTTVELPGMAA